MVFVVLSGLVLPLLACWFVFALLAAVEKIVRAVHNGTPENKIDITGEGMQAAALAILVFILVYMLRRI